MIVIHLNGGLGNQLFQYAYGRWLSRQRQDPQLWLDCRDLAQRADALFENGVAHRAFELHRFKLPARIWDDCHDWRFRGHSLASRAVCRLRRAMGQTGFLDEVMDSVDLPDAAGHPADLYCRGYWHHHFFSSDPQLRAQLRADLDFTPVANARTAEVEADIRNGKAPAVSFHVRRGDYVTAAAAAVQGLCTPDYYRRARQLLERRHGTLRYLVFSDDIQWCRQSLDMPAGTLFVSGDPQLDAHREMYLMTRCHHHVLANSTFSWWGWILRAHDGGDCIAPSRWYADARLQQQIQPRLPPQWLRLPDAP